MNIPKEELIGVLSQFNPWWRGDAIADLSSWKRAAFRALYHWVLKPPAPRAVLLSGARQVGKTTLLLQVVQALLENGVPAANILYVTFDHPILKLVGIDAVLRAWREREPAVPGPEYLFLDEAQFIPHWGTWIKHQVDFNKQRRIALSGSAMPLIEKDQESSLGRLHTIRLTTLSFYEYIQLKHLELPPLPPLQNLSDLFGWKSSDFYRVSEIAEPYTGHFHEYLVRGGFPQTAQVDSVTQAQRLLREDIVDKVLKRDMTALFGVRRVLELEQMFLYLCMNDGSLLDIPNLCSNLAIKRPTVQSFIELLEATHLIYRLPPFGYGKDILRGRFKVYLADAAIAPAVMLKGKVVLEDSQALGIATQTAVYKHLFSRYNEQTVRFSYWLGKKDQEVDFVAELEGQLIPFEAKYRASHTEIADLQGLVEFCQQKKIPYGYVLSKSFTDFGPIVDWPTSTSILRIPAPLFCCWLGASEVNFQSEDRSFL